MDKEFIGGTNLQVTARQ